MLSNKMSYFVTRVSSIFGNIFSTMKNVLLRCQASFQFFQFVFPLEIINRAVAFVKRSVVTLQVVLLESLKTLCESKRCVNY